VPTKDRGFASMTKEQQRAIASKGGKSAHQQGRAYEWTPEAARVAGRKGGLARGRQRKKKPVAGGE
jgi:general stress protein YciG